MKVTNLLVSFALVDAQVAIEPREDFTTGRRNLRNEMKQQLSFGRHLVTSEQLAQLDAETDFTENNKALIVQLVLENLRRGAVNPNVSVKVQEEPNAKRHKAN